VYSVDRSREHYSVTVVDYTGLEQQGIERSKACPSGNAQCRENAGHDTSVTAALRVRMNLRKDADFGSLLL